MAADTVKSTSITNLDATDGSLQQNTSGLGGSGLTRDASDYVAATAAGLADTGSTYRVIRLPSNAVLKDVRIFTKSGLDSSTGLAIDAGAYYSDGYVNADGSPAAEAGAQISANCFVAAQAFGQSGAGSNIDGLSNLDANLRTSPLWKQVGLSSDPGGFIDYVLAVHTSKSGTASPGNIAVTAKFVV